MHTTAKSIHPVDSEANRSFLLIEGIEPTRLISPAGQVFEEYPLLAGVVVPLKQVCFHDDDADPTDPLSANIRLRRLYFREDETGELYALDVSLLRESQFTNRVPAHWETYSVDLKLSHLFPGQHAPVQVEVQGQVDRHSAMIQIASSKCTLPSGGALRLVGYELNATRVVLNTGGRQSHPRVAAA